MATPTSGLLQSWMRAVDGGEGGWPVGGGGGVTPPPSSPFHVHPIHSPKGRRLMRRLRACCFVVGVVALCLSVVWATVFPGVSCADGGAGCGGRLMGGVTDDAVRAARNNRQRPAAAAVAALVVASQDHEGERQGQAKEEGQRKAQHEQEETGRFEEEGREVDGPHPNPSNHLERPRGHHPGGSSGHDGPGGGGHGGGGTQRLLIPAPGHRPAGEANLIVVITPTYSRPASRAPPQPNMLLAMRNALCAGRGHQVLWMLVIGDKVKPQTTKPET